MAFLLETIQFGLKQVNDNTIKKNFKCYQNKKSGTLVPDLVPNNRKVLISSSCL